MNIHGRYGFVFVFCEEFVEPHVGVHILFGILVFNGLMKILYLTIRPLCISIALSMFNQEIQN